MKRIAVTVILIIILFGVIYMGISIFISGPNQSYEKQIADKITFIKEQSEDEIIEMNRYAFQYITYVAKTKSEWVWFNEDGKELLRRTQSEEDVKTIQEVAFQKYNIEDANIQIVYGFENGAYQIETDEYQLLFDYDTLDEIYYRKKV